MEKTDGTANLDVFKQWNFYRNKLQYASGKVAVIISDALRYEVGDSLYEKLLGNEKIKKSDNTDSKFTFMQSMLPSVTETGMAALLPHEDISIAEESNVMADNMPTISTEQREAILKKANPNSLAVRYDDIINTNVDELRKRFANQKIIYVYHNQIDARGDKLSTENEVFVACDEAIDEIEKLIRRLTSAKITHFIVTSDHGFIYKRDKLTPTDKIRGIRDASNRYAISDQPINETGVCSLPLNKFFLNVNS